MRKFKNFQFLLRICESNLLSSKSTACTLPLRVSIGTFILVKKHLFVKQCITSCKGHLMDGSCQKLRIGLFRLDIQTRCLTKQLPGILPSRFQSTIVLLYMISHHPFFFFPSFFDISIVLKYKNFCIFLIFLCIRYSFLQSKISSSRQISFFFNCFECEILSFCSQHLHVVLLEIQLISPKLPRPPWTFLSVYKVTRCVPSETRSFPS